MVQHFRPVSVRHRSGELRLESCHYSDGGFIPRYPRLRTYMPWSLRKTAPLLVVIATGMLIGACAELVEPPGNHRPRLQNDTEPEPPEPTIEDWPVAEPLTGELPVGYWWCVDEEDWDELRTSNNGRDDRPRHANCRYGQTSLSVGHSYLPLAIELRPDGTGYDLWRYDLRSWRISGIPEEAFRITGSSALLFEREAELRWQLIEGGSKLHYQTTYNQVREIEVLTDDVIHVGGIEVLTDTYRRYGRPYLMLRIGSSAYKTMLAFRACVTGNVGRNLFEVEDCGYPLPTKNHATICSNRQYNRPNQTQSRPSATQPCREV